MNLLPSYGLKKLDFGQRYYLKVGLVMVKSKLKS